MTSVESTSQLSAEKIIARASSATGLDDMGTTGFEDRLNAMVDYAAAHPDLDDDALPVFVEELESLVRFRLRFEHDRHATPAIAAERIERPIIVAGSPRSGTTVLHALIAQDPKARTPRAWEVTYPSPPPSLASPDDPRREQATRMIKDWCLRAPGMFLAHPYWDEWAEAPMECESFLTLDLHNTYPTWFPYTPAFIDFNPAPTPESVREGYRWHHAMLQQLQWGGSDQHWVLKGTSHQFSLDVVLDTYPDASVVWIHRNPVEVFASFMELMAVLVEGMSGRAIDRRSIGPQFLQRWGDGLMNGISKPEVDDPRVHHVLYADFIADPPGEVGRLFDRMGRNLSDDHDQLMRSWLASPANRPNRHGKFTYELDWFGLTQAQVRERFADYVDRFDIPG